MSTLEMAVYGRQNNVITLLTLTFFIDFENKRVKINNKVMYSIRSSYFIDKKIKDCPFLQHSFFCNAFIPISLKLIQKLLKKEEIIQKKYLELYFTDKIKFNL